MDSIRTAAELSSINAPALGQRVVYEIPRTADLEKIEISFTGSLTLTTGATALITDGILNLLTSIELLGNSGRDVICSIPFNVLTQGNFARRKNGSAPVITQPGIGIATNTFSVISVIDLACFGGERPKDTNLREGNYASLQLAFRFAPDLTGVYTGAFVTSGQSFTLTVAVHETVELPDASGRYSNPIARPLKTAQDVAIAGAATKVQFKLTPGQGLRGLVFKVQSTATPPVLSDAILSRCRVNVGKVQRLDKSSVMMKAQMALRNPALPPVGYYFIDFADRAGSSDHLTDVLDLSPEQTNGSDSIVEFDTSAACTITVFQDGYIPLAA